ncbi:hypothetical protein KAR91_70450 [Candidatus Pacearchaeota archaeon]|nr:hypothetical protein [Candidatus Pacearchaeota archaeon]
MKNKEKIIELLEKISNMNDEVLELLKGEEAESETQGGSAPPDDDDGGDPSD